MCSLVRHRAGAGTSAWTTSCFRARARIPASLSPGAARAGESRLAASREGTCRVGFCLFSCRCGRRVEDTWQLPAFEEEEGRRWRSAGWAVALAIDLGVVAFAAVVAVASAAAVVAVVAVVATSMSRSSAVVPAQD